jgi:hypothetical protein
MSELWALVKLTRILGVLWANIVITNVQNILVHERGTGSDLSEERHLDWLANLDTLTLLYEDLASVLASILSVQRWNTVLFWVVTLFEWLESRHEVMSAGNTMGNDTLGDTSCDSALYDSSDRVHGSDDLGLELRRHVKFDLLEKVL